MRRNRSLFTGLLVASAVLAAPLSAQGAVQGWRGEFLHQLGTLEGKYTQLANAFPWDKYSWRPGTGVRSVCEVFLHISGENYFLAQSLGAKTPASVNLNTIETCPASKDAVLATMKASFTNMRNAALNTPDGESDVTVDFFGSKITKRALLMAIAEHAGEHLGQQIAYARVNGIVPPWSAPAK
jgi:uncharacterized damage-inducible protein DinB